MQEHIKRIRNKIEKKGINYVPPVSIETIRDFETINNIELPEELIAFYTTICNGCIMLDGFELLPISKWRFDKEKVSKKFIFIKPVIWENENNFNTDEIYNGNIELIDIGDCQTWNIIVSGKEKSKMWFFTDVGMQPAAPSKSFLEWYEYWLDGNDDYFTDYM